MQRLALTLQILTVLMLASVMAYVFAQHWVR